VSAVHRVVVVEDHPIFREGVVQCLDAEPDFTVVGTWATGAIDAKGIARLAPDLVLMDVELPELLFEAMQAGAVGYLLKHVPAPELVRALRALAAGEHELTPELASRFLREFRTRQTTPRPRLPQLSTREEEVLKLLATGETNRQIARRLFVSDETIKSHVAAILRKLEVSDRTSAAVIAVRAGLVDR